jgi:hypothetical protein
LDTGQGQRFAFPDAIRPQKEVWDDLVVNDPTAGPAELVEEGKIDEARAELVSINAQLDGLTLAISGVVGELSTRVVSDMLTRIRKRKGELRELQKVLARPREKAAAPLKEEIHPGVTSADEWERIDAGRPRAGVLSPEAIEQEEKDTAENKLAEIRADTEAEVGTLIAELRTLRDNENKKFADVEAQFKVPMVFGVALSLPDQTEIQPRLAKIKMGYEQWDGQVKQLKDLYTKRGERPDAADQFKPNRARWNQLATRSE